MHAEIGLSRLVHSIAGTFGRQVLGGVLHLVTLALIARFMGPEGSGAFAMGVLIPTMLATFLVIGLPTANVYFVGSRSVSIRTVLRSNIVFLTFISVAGLIIGASLIEFFPDSLLNGIDPIVGWVGLLSFPALLAQNLFLSLLQAKQRFRHYNLISIMQPAVMLLYASSYLVSMKGDSIVLILIGHCVTSFVTAAFALGFVLLDSKTCINESTSDYIRPALKYGLRAHAANILSFLNHKIDMIAISTFLGPASVGLYVAASQITEKLWLLSQAVSTVALPRLAGLEGAEVQRQQLTPLLCRWVLLISLVAGSVVAAIANPIIHAIFGTKFAGSGLIMQILVPGVVLGSVSRVLASDLSARGRPELNMHTSWIAVVINLAGNVMLVPRYGIIGSAISTSFSYAVNMLMRLWMYSSVSHVPAALCLMPNTEDVILLRAMIMKFKGKL